MPHLAAGTSESAFVIDYWIRGISFSDFCIPGVGSARMMTFFRDMNEQATLFFQEKLAESLSSFSLSGKIDGVVELTGRWDH
jgi:hypothetical protein